MEMFKEFIKPEIMVLIPVLNLVGFAIKNSPIKNWTIPYILGLFGIVLSGLYVFSTSDTADMSRVLSALFSALTQGVLCAGCSVYANQLIKQTANKDEGTEN